MFSCHVEKVDGTLIVLLDLQSVPREGERIVLMDKRAFKVADVTYHIGNMGIARVTLTCWIVD